MTHNDIGLYIAIYARPMLCPIIERTIIRRIIMRSIIMRLVKGVNMLKGTKGKVLLYFFSVLLVLVAVLVPFGLIISLTIGRKYGFISDISSLGGIIGSFSGNFSEKRSNNAPLTKNVVLLDMCKMTYFDLYHQLLPILKPLLPLITILTIYTISYCILSIKLV